MTDKSATPGWRKADARELEPYFSKWMLELTAQGLHNKSDIAVVLAMQSTELATAEARIAELERQLAEVQLERDTYMIASKMRPLPFADTDAGLVQQVRDLQKQLSEAQAEGK